MTNKLYEKYNIELVTEIKNCTNNRYLLSCIVHCVDESGHLIFKPCRIHKHVGLVIEE